MKKIVKQGIGNRVPEAAYVQSKLAFNLQQANFIRFYHQVTNYTNFVSVHYNAYVEHEDAPYDSTRIKNRPLRFRLGKGKNEQVGECMYPKCVTVFLTCYSAAVMLVVVLIPPDYVLHTHVISESDAMKNVIWGVDIAVGSMHKKERSKFLISPEYAFGKLGCPPRIPPQATCT